MNSGIQESLKDIGKSAVGVAVAKAVDLPAKLNFGDSFVFRHTSNGAIQASISKAIDYIDGSNRSFNPLLMADDVVFMGGTVAVIDASGVGDMVYERLYRDFKIGADTSTMLVQASALSATRIIGRYLNEEPSVPQALKIFRHPVSYIASTMN